MNFVHILLPALQIQYPILGISVIGERVRGTRRRNPFFINYEKNAFLQKSVFTS